MMIKKETALYMLRLIARERYSLIDLFKPEDLVYIEAMLSEARDKIIEMEWA